MGRVSGRKNVVQIETRAISVAMPKIMVTTIGTLIAWKKTFSNRSDYIVFAIRGFNEMSLEEARSEAESIGINPSLEEIGNSKKRMREKAAKWSERIKCYENNDGELELEGVTFRIPDGMIEYIGHLNNNLWNYPTLQDYIRTAVAWQLIEDLKNGGWGAFVWMYGLDVATHNDFKLFEQLYPDLVN